MLVDSHCHLDMLIEKSENLDDIILSAKNNGISYLQTICTTLEDFTKILDIANKHTNIFASVGVHPCEVKERPVKGDQLISLAQNNKVIGLGETGLDYYHDTSNKTLQITSLQSHIHAAYDTLLPLIIHTRDAEADTIEVLTTEYKHAPFTAVLHCFTGSLDLARKMLDLGFYISFSGIITFNNAEALSEIVRFVPLERILLETDAPYLAPVPMRGKINTPAYVKYTAEKVAILKNLDFEQIAEITTNNFFTLFNKAKRL